MDGTRIVLAHDDESLLRRLRHQLVAAGYSVISCANGEQVLDAITCTERVILLAGAQLAGSTGAGRPDGAVYVILLTSGHPAPDTNGAYAVAFDDYVLESAPQRELLARIRVASHVLQLRSRISRPDADLEGNRAERAARESEARFRELFDHMDSGVAVYRTTDDGGSFVLQDLNQAAERIDAARREEVIGRHVSTVFPAAEESGLLPMLRRVWRTGQPERLPPTYYRDERISGWRECYVYKLPSGDVASVYDDVTERKEAERELRRAHRETEQLLASISSLLIGVDDSDRVMLWNATAERTFGFASADVLGHPLRECGIAWNWDLVAEGIARCRRERQPTRLEDIRITRPDGGDGFLGVVINPIRNGGAAQLALLLVGADITERRVLEGQLAQAQKLESIGQLAAGIAHEINTPTQFVGDNTRFLQDSFADLQMLLDKYAELLEAGRRGAVAPELIAEVEAACEKADLDYLVREIPQAIAQSLEGIERVTRIVRAMKDFSHPGGEEKEAVDLNKAIESTTTVARNEWKYVAELVTDLDPALPPVPCFVGDFNQVVLNIIINAAHAIGDVVGDGSAGKGTITISTRQEGDWAEVRISDTGTGIPPRARSKVFDPFFTTKEVGKGTGQGLAIAYSVITERHGGTITFETETKRGTTFVIRLPIESRSAGAQETAPHEAACSLR